MNRREPGYLIPEQRRLEHVWSLACRNLAAPDAATGPQGTRPSGPPDVFFTLCTGDGDATPVYRSEVAPHTVNPAWVPMEWTYLQQPSGPPDVVRARAELVRTPTLRLRIYGSWRSSKAQHDGDASFRNPLYFPSSQQLREAPCACCGSATLMLDTVIDLRDLWFLGFDVTEALASIDSTVTTGARGKSAAPEQGGSNNPATSADLPPDAAGYVLDALPMNTLVFWLDDGHYTLPELGRAMLRQPTEGIKGAIAAAAAAAAAATAAGGRGEPQPAKHDLRRGFDAVNRLMQLRRDTLVARAETASAVAQISALTGGTAPTVPPTPEAKAVSAVLDADAQLLATAQRVAALRAKRDAAVAAAAEAEREAAALRAAAVARASALRTATLALSEKAAVVPDLEARCEGARSSLSVVRTLITAKQISLLHELRSLYPIVELEAGRRYTIRGIALPDRDLTSLPEEQVSTALGYCAHLVALVSKYALVPLRYRPTHAASRSTMRDEAVAAGREFPLYWKGPGASLDDFGVALLMLRRDVAQLLHSQGLAQGPAGAHLLGQLQRLFSSLLDLHIPPPPGPAALASPAAASAAGAGAARSGTVASSGSMSQRA